ncbi:NAD(P)-dependent alcohol dehydrogenase [Mycobacterium sp. PS03-16]|uniref:NAD(P)-dependent alcohol dehydrogenase n=1 Tax=Mycobacterium sp. PS03-16 TaxID=2559611 RepID=UPI0014319FC8|nr:NAD(P)-dependent alcohol dehydrogenase [Mycobacterium sp. PS03-16]
MTTRRAMVLDDFGGPEKLRLAELPMPALRHPDEVLVRVHATSVNPIEWKMRSGLGVPKPVWRRLIGTPMILGQDFAGEVLAAGDDAGGLAPGDAVMGALPVAGAYTTHLTARVKHRRTAIIRKPDAVSHTEAAVTPFAGLVAYAGLVTYGGLTSPGARVLVVGASGGVGHLAAQMAKALGADLVAGVCSSRNEAFARGCGVDEVLPYDRIPLRDIPSHQPDWAHSFDLILDCVGDDGYFTVLAPWLLKPAGRFVTAALPSSRPGRPGEDVGLVDGAGLFARMLRRRVTGRYRLIPGLFGLPVTDGMPAIARWLGDGSLRPLIASTYPLTDLPAAHRESEKGRTVGKIAVTTA